MEQCAMKDSPQALKKQDKFIKNCRTDADPGLGGHLQQPCGGKRESYWHLRERAPISNTSSTPSHSPSHVGTTLHGKFTFKSSYCTCTGYDAFPAAGQIQRSRGVERRGEERRGEESGGEERRGEERRAEERRGEESGGEGRRGEERRGGDRRGEERRGESLLNSNLILVPTPKGVAIPIPVTTTLLHQACFHFLRHFEAGEPPWTERRGLCAADGDARLQE
eukprot:768625-Hanusia_phi.AAC.2